MLSPGRQIIKTCLLLPQNTSSLKPQGLKPNTHISIEHDVAKGGSDMNKICITGVGIVTRGVELMLSMPAYHTRALSHKSRIEFLALGFGMAQHWLFR